eukprot:Filipodium_phascolosomae@DN2007_c0_g1_i1.p1
MNTIMDTVVAGGSIPSLYSSVMRFFITYWVEITTAVVFGLGFYILRPHDSLNRRDDRKGVSSSSEVSAPPKGLVEDSKRWRKPYNSYDGHLKALATSGDLKALEVFDEMIAVGFRPSEGTNVGVISLCAESQFVRLAEHVFNYLRANKEMTLSVYSAMMKVYAYAGMYTRACELYNQLNEDGIQPDNIMYGCLMKFAVECGRIELARELFSKTNPDIQNYMSLIRACGREKNVVKALGVLEQLRSCSKIPESGVVLDTTAYNCCLDVCVSCADLKSANKLFAEMKKSSNVDVISYNTLLKGHCASGDLSGAERVLRQMSEDGFVPNDVSFNSMINAAVSMGQHNFAWSLVGEMEQHGVEVDHYTCSIMMKALKTTHSKTVIDKTLKLLDRVNPAHQDEVLFNTLLDTCIRLRDSRRLDAALRKFRESGLRSSTHTYGTLIKASGFLHRVEAIRAYWHEMTIERHMDPTEVTFGCMFDALVNAGLVEEAMELFEEMTGPNSRYSVQPNTVMYSTLIKGFAQQKQTDKAISLYERMVANKVACNAVTFNSLIDGCARVGAMDKACELLEEMTKRAGLSPDLITYSTIIKGYCMQGDIEHSMILFDAMRRRKIEPDAILYNSLLDGSARIQRVDLCEKLLRDMKVHGILPSNFTLTILVKLFGKMKDLEKAFSVVEDLPNKHEFEINAHVYTCLMSACNANGKTNRALEVFDKMKSRGVVPDSKTFGTLIMGCTKSGLLRRACELVEEAIEVASRIRINSTHGAGNKSSYIPGQKRSYGNSNQSAANVVVDDFVLKTLFSELQRKQMYNQYGAPLAQKVERARRY